MSNVASCGATAARTATAQAATLKVAQQIEAVYPDIAAAAADWGMGHEHSQNVEWRPGHDPGKLPRRCRSPGCVLRASSHKDQGAGTGGPRARGRGRDMNAGAVPRSRP
eukprot:364777-Chlamydomonas_euryale.AAC.6